MNTDLTVGKAERVLWKFCIPLFGSILFQQLYQIADSWVAGKFIGENALAAVGNSYEITLLFIAFAFGCNIGCSVVVSRLFGGKQFRNMKTAVSTAMISSAVLCALLMVFGVCCSGLLLQAIRTPQEILADSRLYLDIYIWGLPFLLFYHIATGIFSALGDSKTPFLFLAISSTANIVVDILLVAGFHMGVSGVAWATFLCQSISCILALVAVLRRLAGIAVAERIPLFSFKLLGDLASIAVPSILQQSFISIGNILIQSVINSCGVGVAAGYAAAIKLNNLVTTSFTTLGNGISNYTAQNLGAGLNTRIREGFRAGVKMVWLLCLLITLVYLTAARQLITFFIQDPSKAALDAGMHFLYVVVPFYFIMSTKLVADGVLRGSGLMKRFMVTTFTDLVLRVSLASILSRSLGYLGIWCAWPIGWSVATVLSLLFYRKSFQENRANVRIA